MRLLLAGLLLLLCQPAQAARIRDEGELLKPATVEALKRLTEAHERETGIRLSLLTSRQPLRPPLAMAMPKTVTLLVSSVEAPRLHIGPGVPYSGLLHGILQRKITRLLLRDEKRNARVSRDGHLRRTTLRERPMRDEAALVSLKLLAYGSRGIDASIWSVARENSLFSALRLTLTLAGFGASAVMVIVLLPALAILGLFLWFITPHLVAVLKQESGRRLENET